MRSLQQKQTSNAHGFTLVELLVALTVTGLIIGITMNFMLNNMVQSTITSTRADLLREAQITLNIANNDIQLSANADTNNRWLDPNSPGAPLNQQSWVSGSHILILATAAADSSDNIIFSDALNYITQKNNMIYFVTNGILYKRTLASPVLGNSSKTSCPKAVATNLCPADKALVHNVTSFNVSYLDGDNNAVAASSARSIEITLGLSKTAYKQNVTASYTTRMVFRND